MIVRCSNCNTRYLIDPRALGSEGRTVRCVKCSNTWHQYSSVDMPYKLEPQIDVLSPERKSAPIPPDSNLPAIIDRKKKSNLFSWFFVTIVILTISGSVLLARQPIAYKWPRTTGLYSAIGLNVYASNPSGLEFRNLIKTNFFQDGQLLFLIKGEIWNTTGQNRRVPKISLGLVDGQSYELQGKIISAKLIKLKAGLSTTFETQLPASRGAVSIVAGFVE